jgi:hypothetical protein
MSATKGIGAIIVTNTTPKPKGFFSLPRELRDDIYDILHHELDAEVAQLMFHFRYLEVKARLINRRFTEEFNMRASSTTQSQLLVTHKPANQRWYPDEQPHRLPELPMFMQDMHFTHIEFNFDMHDSYCHYYYLMSDFHEYSEWIGNLLVHEPHLVSHSRGGELHLQLSFRYVTNLKWLAQDISKFGCYGSGCTKISMVLLGVQKPTPTMKKLGLHIYSDMPQILAVWDKLSGWKVEQVVSKQARIERVSGLDPFDPSTFGIADVDDGEINWAAFEDGNYHALEGSGWDTNESVIEQSRAEWNGGGEGSLANDGVQEESRWEVDDSVIELSGLR